MELCNVILRTNRVRCALNTDILDLLNEESVSGARSGELVDEFDEKSYCECLKKKGESIAKVRFKYFFVHKHRYVYGRQPRSLYPRSRCVCGGNELFISITTCPQASVVHMNSTAR